MFARVIVYYITLLLTPATRSRTFILSPSLIYPILTALHIHLLSYFARTHARTHIYTRIYAPFKLYAASSARWRIAALPRSHLPLLSLRILRFVVSIVES